MLTVDNKYRVVIKGVLWYPYQNSTVTSSQMVTALLVLKYWWDDSVAARWNVNFDEIWEKGARWGNIET